MVHRFYALALGCAGVSSASAQVLTETAGVVRTCEAGPDAALARAQRLSGAAHVTAAAVLPNPSLVGEHQRTLSGASDNETIVGVSVPLSVGGRRSLLRDAARVRVEQAASSATLTLFESALEFRRAYATATLDQARVAALSEQQALLDALSKIIEALAQGGEVSQYDLLRQRVQARLHQRTVEAATAHARGSLSFLETWMGSKVVLAPTPVLELAGGSAGTVEPSLAHHPSLEVLQGERRASALEARAARRRWVPDLELFGGYRAVTVEDAIGHGFSVSLSVPLTFFDHGQGEAAIAEASQARAAGEEEQLRRRYEARLTAATTQLESLSKSSAELESIGAEAAVLLDKTRQLYAAGEATLTELLEAFRAVAEARLGVIDLAEELVRVRLERMAAAGSQLDAALDEACSGSDRSKP